MKYYQTFVVEGAFSFPFDMLRYDRCWPDSESVDNLSMSAIDRELYSMRRQVRLCRNVDLKTNLPTVGRWSSFGWKVLENTIKTQKV